MMQVGPIKSEDIINPEHNTHRMRRFVEDMTQAQIIQCIKDNVDFERIGYIGDCTLRTKAREFKTIINSHDGNIVYWMREIVNECYRVIAEKALVAGFVW